MIKEEKIINISNLCKTLKLVSSKNQKPLNHVIRYWEKEFKQINPIIHKKRRYYSKKHVELFKLIKFLLKDKGLTVSGVKKILNSKINSLDAYKSDSLKADYFKKNIKERSNLILDKLKKIKNYGKKNSY
tara:strand:- start:8028 stop:8417 length:390 start_codon:yes stop_codon:yes gene_type:complete